MTADLSNSSSEPTDTSSAGISRRTVVRGAAVTAWAVPAVTLATTTPAFAASAAKLFIESAVGKWTWTGPTGDLEYTIKIRNDGGQAAPAITIALGHLPYGSSNVYYHHKKTDPISPWSGELSDKNGTIIRYYVASMKRGAGLGPGKTETVTFKIELWDGGSGGSSIGSALGPLAVTASATGLASATSSISIPSA